MTDFAELLYRSLPGIYRQKDENLELARFLQIMAAPLAETEASIGQLYDDLFGASARGELLPLVGALIGADIDPSLPPSLQRAALEETLAFHRNKGLADPLERTVQAFTGFTTVAVDYSQVVARLPYLETMSPILRRRGRPVAWDAAAGSAPVNRFYFDTTRKVTPLFDEQRGRAIARGQLATQAAELVGTDRGFGLRENGAPLLGPGALLPLTVIGANLTDFASPLNSSGQALVLTAGQVGVDPELGRFVFAAAAPAGSLPGRQWPPLPGNLTVDFHQLVPTSITTQTFDLRDSARVGRLGRSDDPAPYTVDLRSPARPRDRIGRAHYDNHGFFLTVGRRFDSRRPNLLRNATFVGYSFDDRPLDPSNTVGVPLQLQDGFDGSPLTVNDLAGREADYFDTAVGFTVRARGLSLSDPSFGAGVRVLAARLSDLANPKDPAGQPLTLQARDLAVDPQWGRFLLNPSSFGVRADEIRVGYLLAGATRYTGGSPAVVPVGASSYAFAADGTAAPLVDAFDGATLAAKLRLGSAITDFHGQPRGYKVLVGTTDLTATLTAQLASIETPPVTAPAGKMLVDLDRGRFALPAGAVPAGAVLTVEYSALDQLLVERVFASLAQRLPRQVPAGIEPVIVDTRRNLVDNTPLELVSRAQKL